MNTDENLFELIEVAEVLVPGEVVANVEPEPFHRIEFRRIWGQVDQGDVLGYLERLGNMPACAIKNDNVACIRMIPCRFRRVIIHGFAVGERADEALDLAAFGADRGKEIEVVSADATLVGRPAAALGPDAAQIGDQPET